MKLNTGSLKRSTKLINFQRESAQINKIRNVKEFTMNIIEKQRIIGYYYKQLYAKKKKMDNLEEMDRFLQRYNFPRLNQEEKENINRPDTGTKIETVITKLPKNKSPGQDGFTGKVYETHTER